MTSSNNMTSKLKYAFILILLIFIAMFYIIPLEWTIASSLRPAGSLYEYANPLTWKTFFPTKITFRNYINIFVKEDFARALANSLFVALISMILGIIVNSMAGFALAKFIFPGKTIFFYMVLMTFMIPFESIVIPLYIVVKKLGLLNSYYALIIPAVGNGLAIFLFRQFFAEIPDELLETARIDGASWLGIYWRILLPLSLPAVVTVLVMLFMFQWNSLFWPIVAAYSSKYQVVQVAVAAHRLTEQTHWANLFSSAVAGGIPPMLLFLLLQRYYVRGISTTGLK